MHKGFPLHNWVSSRQVLQEENEKKKKDHDVFWDFFIAFKFLTNDLLVIIADVDKRSRCHVIAIYVKSIKIALIFALLIEIQHLPMASGYHWFNKVIINCTLFLCFLTAILSRINFESKTWIVKLAKASTMVWRGWSRIWISVKKGIKKCWDFCYLKISGFFNKIPGYPVGFNFGFFTHFIDWNISSKGINCIVRRLN